MASLFVDTHIASDLTVSASPPVSAASSTAAFTPSAPMRISMSVAMSFFSFRRSVSSPDPMPASAHAESRGLSVSRA